MHVSTVTKLVRGALVMAMAAPVVQAARTDLIQASVATADQVDTVALNSSAARAEVSLFGAQVLSYVPKDGRDVFFRVPGFAPGTRDFGHGGVPIAWPWFGRKKGTASGEFIHGFSRRLKWHVVSQAPDKVTLAVSSDDETRRLFPHDFKLTTTVTLADRLTVAFTVVNTGADDLPFGAGFHPFFRVSDNTKLKLAGVEGLNAIPAAVDKVYPCPDGVYDLIDDGFARRIRITAKGTNQLCLWNESAQWPAIYARGGGRDFCCVEPILHVRDAPAATLKPGESRTLTMVVQVL